MLPAGCAGSPQRCRKAGRRFEQQAAGAGRETSPRTGRVPAGVLPGQTASVGWKSVDNLADNRRKEKIPAGILSGTSLCRGEKAQMPHHWHSVSVRFDLYNRQGPVPGPQAAQSGPTSQFPSNQRNCQQRAGLVNRAISARGVIHHYNQIITNNYFFVKADFVEKWVFKGGFV